MRQLQIIKQALVPAGEIDEGECFRKKTGNYIYQRISESAIRFYIERDKKNKEGEEEIPLGSIYGVCLHNGNMCKVSKETEVWPEKVEWVNNNLEG